MPLILIGLGLVLIVVAAENTASPFYKQLYSDLTGGFFKWALALIIIGAVGYIPKLKGLSTAFLTLVILGLVISNRSKLQQFLTGGLSEAAPPSVNSTGSGTGTF